MARAVDALLAAALGLIVARAILPARQTRLSIPSGMSEAQLLQHVRSHSIVHVGGQHRGGTTLMWAALGTHPDVASHGRPEQLVDDEDERCV